MTNENDILQTADGEDILAGQRYYIVTRLLGNQHPTVLAAVCTEYMDGRPYFEEPDILLDRSQCQEFAYLGRQGAIRERARQITADILGLAEALNEDGVIAAKRSVNHTLPRN